MVNQQLLDDELSVSVPRNNQVWLVVSFHLVQNLCIVFLLAIKLGNIWLTWGTLIWQ